jgi:rhamnogalacturonyl hydrolase YesR
MAVARLAACAFAYASLPSAAAAPVLPPQQVAQLAIAHLISLFPGSAGPGGLHHLPDYGVAIEYSAAYEAMRAFPALDFSAFLAARLDAFAQLPGSPAQLFLAGQTIPWGYSIGDTTGLFPIAYLARALHLNATDPATSQDARLALGIAQQYVLGWPLRLADGTISRHAGWYGQPDANASFLWQDDQFMGLALVARLARHVPLPAATRAGFLDFLAAQHAGFAARCQDAASGLYLHGYNEATRARSCCPWGRANGWVMMAHAEVAQALAAGAHPALPAVLAVWQRHAAALAAAAPPPSDPDARLHQVLDAPATFHETSVSAMACYSLATGVLRGFLSRAQFDAPLRALYGGVAGAVSAATGEVAGICEGTGIGNTTAFYQARSTAYASSSPGLGSVFRCAAAMGEYLAAWPEGAL